ncbi:MAG TPA: TonB-dependent receptor [Terriglobales bacterium]|nr:TonB-dependent receptor [Terriglobales bacterium]
MRLQRKSVRWYVLVCLSLLLGLAVPRGVFGQATTGTISGVVSDPTPGTVPGAVVAVRNLDTNATHSVTTEADGRFNFPGLPVGPYEITIEKAGFGKYKQGPIVLLLNQVAVVNVTLKPAAVSETVTVTEDAPLLNTTNPEVGVRFDSKRISDLPTNPPGGIGSAGGFRDVFAFALSAPGVSQLNSGNSTFATGTNFSVNGTRPRGNNFVIDGQDSNDPSVTGRQQVINNTDIVQEFRLITNQFAPEYGRAAGSVVNVVTKSGANQYHGSAFWFYSSNAMNAPTNLDKAAGFIGAPFYNEHQYGGTAGGPIIKDKTFFFGSLQRWTIRRLGSGTTISGVPTTAGDSLLQSTVGTRPQVAALLKFVPGAARQGVDKSGNPTFASFCNGGGSLPNCTGGTRVDIPTGSITGAISSPFDNWQASGRIDHRFNNKHSLGGRYLYSDSTQAGIGQATPPGLATSNLQRTQALTAFLTSNLTPRTVNELRTSWQRLASNTTPTDPASLSISSIEIAELGLTGFNSDVSRTAIGLAVNQPQFRFNNTYQLQDTFSWTKGSHAMKFGIDFRRVDVKSFFVPTIRGRLSYPTLQNFVDDVASVADINQALPGGATINHYRWYDYYFFWQDTWSVWPTFSLTYGLRYEAPGNALASLYPLNDSIVGTNGGGSGFLLSPRPGRDLNDFQPRVGFSWNPRFNNGGLLSRLTGSDKLVVRGGYARTNDYAFINLALNVASSFPFLAASSRGPLANAFTQLPQTVPNLSDPSKVALLTRTVLGGDFRSPDAEQFSLEIQRQIKANSIFRVGYVGTKGTGLFQTLDGNPRTLCSAVPITVNAKTGAITPLGCPRVNPTLGVIRLRANAGSSIYHSLQISYDRRFANGLTAGAHYTWSAFIDSSSDTFNPSARGEVAIAQQSFNLRADRGRSTYDRPQRLSANIVYELPFFRGQSGFTGHVVGGWQIASFLTFQSGSPWSPLNGVDPTNALGGIDGLVGSAIRPDLNTSLNVFGMSSADVLKNGGAALFKQLAGCTQIGTSLTCAPGERFGNVGRNILRSNRLKDVDISVSKTTRITEHQSFQIRLDMFDMSNTRNFGIPEARISNSGFARQESTNGGSRNLYVGLRYIF